MSNITSHLFPVLIFVMGWKTTGTVTISNDGATIMKLLDIVHPAAKTLVDIARSQDAEVGDGTTSVVLLAGELLKEIRSYVEEGVNPQVIIKGYRRAAQLAINKVKEIAVSVERKDENEFRSLLEKCAATAMSSKLIHSQTEFFTKMVVDAVLHLDQEELDESLIGMKRVTGGAMQDSLLIDGVAFKKTFSYAGFEQQPKSFKNPKVLSLNVELELKAERDNAEVRVEAVDVSVEWFFSLNTLTFSLGAERYAALKHSPNLFSFCFHPTPSGSDHLIATITGVPKDC